MSINLENEVLLAINSYNEENYPAAICHCKNIINSGNNGYQILVLLASSLEKNTQFSEAINIYKLAMALKSDSYSIYKKIADIYYLCGNDPNETIKYYERFLTYYPSNLDAKSCLGLAYLKTKNYKDGWVYFESRYQKQESIFKRIEKGNFILESKPLWSGENISDKVVYVYAEAGYGDTIMFSRFILKLQKICKKVLFEPEIENYELFKYSFQKNNNIEVLKSDEFASYPDFDFHIPIMSLPFLLKINSEEEISSIQKYVSATPSKVEAYKEKYFNNTKFKIGIKWQGRENMGIERKIKLEYFFKLFSLKGIKFYSLQKDDGIEQLKNAKEFNLVDLGSTFSDFSDTAAAIENLDLVICNDTSVAHLAGALGKPCWVLLPFSQDWRWTTNLSYSPWYKNTKLFHQSESCNWDEVFEEVYSKLVVM